jgi:FkbM family methyltransferase
MDPIGTVRRTLVDPVRRLGPIWRRRPRRLFVLAQCRRFRRGPITFRRSGFRWTGFSDDVDITWSVYADGDYQPRARRALVRRLEEDGWLAAGARHVVDVGANLGTTALPLARDHGFMVLAIEPWQAVFDLLERNVRQNRLEDRIVCVRAAVGPESRSRELLLPIGSSGRAELAQTGPLPEDGIADVGVGGVAEVRTAPLSELLREQNVEPADVAFVWSDAQGSDGHVISTGRELWDAGVPLYMELWPDGLRHQGAYAPVAEAASYGFSSFIAKRELIGEVRPRLRPVAELGVYMAACGRDHTDVLLVPERRRSGA